MPASAAAPTRTGATADVARRLPALDGVRGLAITLVVVHHALDFTYELAGVPVLGTLVRLGWVGVDLFFVLSGFLITRILLVDIARPRGLRRFAVRRVFRLLPPCLALLAILALLATVGSRHGMAALLDVESFLRRPWWFVGYATNILIVLEGWEAAGQSLEMLWSLAVEEQFYLVWPLLLLATGPRRPWLLALACVVAAPLLRLATVDAPGAETIAYVLMPTRADALAAGALVATLPVRLSPRLAAACGGAALAVLTLIVVRDGPEPWTVPMRVFGYSAIALACAAFVHVAATAPPQARLARLLGARPLVALGTWSYVVYLVHQPLATWLTHAAPFADAARWGGPSWMPGLLALGTYVAGSLAIAAASWRWFETPLQRVRDRVLALRWLRDEGRPVQRVNAKFGAGAPAPRVTSATAPTHHPAP